MVSRRLPYFAQNAEVGLQRYSIEWLFGKSRKILRNRPVAENLNLEGENL